MMSHETTVALKKLEDAKYQLEKLKLTNFGLKETISKLKTSRSSSRIIGSNYSKKDTLISILENTKL